MTDKVALPHDKQAQSTRSGGGGYQRHVLGGGDFFLLILKNLNL
jgi:hypothetical protein